MVNVRNSSYRAGMEHTDELTRWLLDTDPALRWQVQRDLLGADEGTWRATRTLVATEGMGAALLAEQDPDGQWAGGSYFPEAGHPTAWVKGQQGQPWTATTWSLKTLREWGLDAAALAGVGVMFYTMLALRAELRERGAFAGKAEPNLAELLDLVALGTVADVVRLDHNNRILVAQGLQRMRADRMQPGIRALFAAAGRDASRATTFDMGFALGPRLNAAGRLADMSLGIECLITDDMGRALNIAQELDKLNRERRAIEADMQQEAMAGLDGIDPGSRASLTLFQPEWHQGVIGILAGRIKEKFHRPTIAFARGNDGEIKGSGRSIPGLHLRDALDLVTKQAPDLILRFGGHAMAAGLTIREHDLPRFEALFEEVVRNLIDPADLTRRLETDGALEDSLYNLETARLLEREIWGQGFAPPVFDDVFRVENQRILKEKHLKLQLRKGNTRIDAIQFNNAEPAAQNIHAAFRLAVNEYNGVAGVQLMLEHFEAA